MRLALLRVLDALLRSDDGQAEPPVEGARAGAGAASTWWRRNRRVILVGLAVMAGMFLVQLVVETTARSRGIDPACTRRFSSCSAPPTTRGPHAVP